MWVGYYQIIKSSFDVRRIEKMEEMYCLVYRTGGTDNFKWQYGACMEKSLAYEKKKEVERMGYKCLVYKYKDVVSIGLPETFES